MKKISLVVLAMISVVVIFWHCTTTSEVIKGSEEHIREVTASINDDVLKAQADEHGDWITHGRSYKEDRHSKLDKITKENVSQLGLAWALEVGTKRGIQGTPLVRDGIMFATGPWSVLWAIDVRSGEIIWEFDPIADRGRALDYCCGVINRGPALYKGAVIWGTLDGRLVSVDAATGTKNWEVLTIPEDSQYSITGAPRIANGRVIIGNGGAEFTARGYVSAYDAETGELAWRFYTVPGNPADGFEQPELEEAAKTWNGEWWANGGGGGTVWDAIVFDPDLNTLYIGVGNGTHWDRSIRSPGGGDNLFLASVVALDATTGAYKWHFQHTPGDTWDYTSTQPITLAEIEIDGEMRKVLMQAPKNGFFYVIDRVTGEFISGETYGYVSWASGLDQNGRPIENEGVRYRDGRTWWITPSSHGAHNWQPQAFNPDLGLMYIPASVQAGPYARMGDRGAYDPESIGGKAGVNISMNAKLYNPPAFDTNPLAPPPGAASGRLVAYDPAEQKIAWDIPQSSHYNGGLLTTSTGLVFQVDAKGVFAARDGSTGDILWSYDTRSGGIAAPITYLVDDMQYITIPVGWGGGQGQTFKFTDRLHQGTFFTFKLGGTAEPLEKLPPLPSDITTLTTDAPPENIGNGFDLFTHFCIGCHVVGTGGGALPDLARSNEGIYDIYESILLDGRLEAEGMPNLGEYLSAEDVADLKSYVLYTASELRKGTDPIQMMTDLAGMQYLSDTKGPTRASIE